MIRKIMRGQSVCEATTASLGNEFEAYASKRPVPLFRDIHSPQGRIDINSKWRTLWLRVYGKNVITLEQHFPQTKALLDSIPCVTAMITILHPGTILNIHHGPTNAVWRYHLGLIVPQNVTHDDLGLLIMENASVVHDLMWSEGDELLFVDSFKHAAWNQSPHPRVILFLDIERQDIPPGLIKTIYQYILAWVGKYHPFARHIINGATSFTYA